jgi:plasmid stabilization system protein ParE
MKRRYILAPMAAGDLVSIWQYVKEASDEETADRVESVIRDKIAILADAPGLGHWRRDLTVADVRFFPVYSYFDCVPP